MKRHPLLRSLPVLRLLTALSLTSIPSATAMSRTVATGYYPSGLPYAITAGEAATDRLHTGKQFIDHNGAGLHDNGARLLDGILCEYISVDPLSDKYPSMSHYVHCADNPLSYIDPDVRKIVAVYDGISGMC